MRDRKRLLIGAAAVAAVGALVGTGFTVQASVATAESVAMTESLADLGGRDASQLGAYGAIGAAHAKKAAADTLTVANDTLSSVDGKVDAGELKASVASLGDYKTLPIGEVTELTAKAKAAVASARAGAAEFDRKKAEEAAAAAQAAAEAQAALNTPDGARAYAAELAASQYGWGADQFSCLDSLWNKESGWNYQAVNASSGAWGIPQSLPGDKMATVGADWQTNAGTQVAWGLGYIQAAYGTPCAAWSHSQAVDWY
ncbi:hypothetical protein G127AT_01335 [Agromyces archimandritae]|uniref:Phospholipase n=1 Tax=Agromyces archimandritae TaxID=2781962 RepID=A0A975FQR3_9MICO|nr:hypothetical protein G127AT_01335 [Agromyces archimandritae]